MFGILFSGGAMAGVIEVFHADSLGWPDERAEEGL